MSLPAIPVRVLLFARYAELVGRHAIDLQLPAGATVADAVSAVRAAPGGDRIPARPLVALGASQVHQGQVLHPGDELALLPPMAGG